VDAAAARQGLIDAAAWYSLSGHTASEPTMAAAEALAAGVDSPALRELAGAASATPRYELATIAAAAFEELDLRFREWQSEEGKRSALVTLARRYREGELTASELTGWAHSTIGQEAADDLVASGARSARRRGTTPAG
jgi:hypothetical protein